MRHAWASSLFCWRELSLLLLFCVVIAGFLQLVGGDGWRHNLVFSLSIGLSIYSAIKLLIYLRHATKDDFVSYVIGIPAGGVLGVAIGAMLMGMAPSQLFTMLYDGQHGKLLIPVLSAILFGTAIAWFFHSREKMARQALQLKEEARQRSEQEKSLAETQLRLLQAQIEPHFLFNALANVISLIEHDPGKAKCVLESLSDFLRVSLQRTRNETATLRDEIALLTAYLDVQQVRMGERLRYRINCPEALLALSLPPLLVQPLVENALQHGLENRVEGGEIRVLVEWRDRMLRVQVSDNGDGIRHHGETGVGLRNIRHRLQALYGGDASLQLTENVTGGVTAQLMLPAARGQEPGS